MDVQYRISGDVVSDSAVLLASPPLPSDSKMLRSESDIIATSIRGSCGVDPGPVPWRTEVSLSWSPMGDWLYGVGKRLLLVSSMFSTLAMQCFMASTLRGGGTYLTLTRPTKGSLGVTGVFEGIAPSSA